MIDEVCNKELEKRNLDEKYKKRLKLELKEIKEQKKEDYFLNLNKENKKYKNKNNLLVPYLLNICDEFNIDADPVYDLGESPDIDVDYIDIVRDYLKDEWLPKIYGEQYVSSIGTTGTYGIRSSLIDMSRIHDLDIKEIMGITTSLNAKDDDGEILTWHKALEIPSLKEYCEKYPDVADSASKLLSRNKSRGKHAAGIVISNIPLDDFLPVEIDRSGKPVSAWAEGQATQDLQPVGLLKFDLLITLTNKIVSYCCKLIKERHDIKSICALPGKHDWSDIDALLFDEKALDLANQGDLKGIFQFDSPGIRKLVISGGVSEFEDLAVYNALYRPSTLQSGQHHIYIKRKTGKESYKLHPLMESILGKTYGVMVFQEDVMKILNIVGLIPMKNTYDIIKGISKKKIEKFAKYKDEFIKNGQQTLSWTEEQVIQLWKQIEDFAGYGFNKSHSVSYAYNAINLLWLKAHYPFEFYAALLKFETDQDKIKEYRIDAYRHGIEIQPLNLNKSKANFEIVDNKIYYGFSSIKGIEKESAKIVANQPYNSFVDFLEKFGTKANVIKPLIALRVFNDKPPAELYKFYEHYKNALSKKIANDTRYKNRLKKLEQNLEDEKTHKKYLKLKEDKVTINLPKIDDLLKDIDINKEYLDLLLDESRAQREYYGFEFIHDLQLSPDYSGITFDEYNYLVETENLAIGPIEVKILLIEKKEWKNKKGFHYVLHVEDALGVFGKITVWSDDYERFKEELSKNNLIRIRIKPPEGFSTYTFESFPRNLKHKIPPKERDYRIIVMRKK